MSKNSFFVAKRVNLFSLKATLVISFFLSLFNVASANNSVGATWVPIQVDDITIMVPAPFKVGRPDVGSDCLQPGISDALKFACTFLTENIWHNANNTQNLRLPYVEYNAEYSPGVPYAGPLLRGEPGTPNWYPFFNSLLKNSFRTSIA